ncbi:hypothetical protein EYF80_014309 [Liparis tanakae]|uniref:Uncharacterized protein n=1 Tax=Liparis tanakae TaxID=230148 RepID=A0A4Z2IBZ3_9TELE|nr:hypothetical protein EYF80_014309 [Liparis tanakae]
MWQDILRKGNVCTLLACGDVWEIGVKTSSGVYHPGIHSIIPGKTGLSSEQGNETTCQGRGTKREHVEERIRAGEEVLGFGEGKGGMQEESEPFPLKSADCCGKAARQTAE